MQRMGQKELAVLMQKGARTPNVYESCHYLLEKINDIFYASALGAGIVGKFESASKAYTIVQAEKEKYSKMGGNRVVGIPIYIQVAANLLNISFSLADSIDLCNMRGKSTIYIIDKLWKEEFPN